MASRDKISFLVSACLAGINCTHKGRNNLKRKIKKLVIDGKAIAVCPEISGGLPVPREPSEIVGGSGADVLTKKAKVLTYSGRDVSDCFIKGARKTLSLAKRYKIKKAILKGRSPSCGIGKIYDGTFSRKSKKGSGVTAALLKANGINIYDEKYNKEW